jgi:hypothetical protein
MSFTKLILWSASGPMTWYTVTPARRRTHESCSRNSRLMGFVSDDRSNVHVRVLLLKLTAASSTSPETNDLI